MDAEEYEYDLKKITNLSIFDQLDSILRVLSIGFPKLAYFNLLTRALFKAFAVISHLYLFISKIPNGFNEDNYECYDRCGGDVTKFVLQWAKVRKILEKCDATQKYKVFIFNNIA